MLPEYKDITSRIKEKPKWWDDNGVPRYDSFKTDDAPSIYAKMVLLVLIECQSCGQFFKVSGTYDTYKLFNNSEEMLGSNFHYGDPPRHNCIGGGETMNCTDIKILECWVKEINKWVRKTEHEILLCE